MLPRQPFPPLSRRVFIAGGAAVGAGSLFAQGTGHAFARRGKPVKDLVFIHGAWHGGWCWEPVRAVMGAQGFRVHALTLPGLAERAAELTADIGLKTHIDDAIGQIRALNLEQFVLVGHSYGGMVITGIADRLKEKIAHIIYLDAALPGDGQTMLSYGEPRSEAAISNSEQVMRGLAPDGIGMVPFPPAMFGIPKDHELYDWVAEKLTPHPLKTWLDPISLERGGPEGLNGTYVLCTDPMLAQTQFAWVASQLEGRPDWCVIELPTGHDAMITDPQGVARIVAEAASVKQKQ